MPRNQIDMALSPAISNFKWFKSSAYLEGRDFMLYNFLGVYGRVYSMSNLFNL